MRRAHLRSVASSRRDWSRGFSKLLSRTGVVLFLVLLIILVSGLPSSPDRPLYFLSIGDFGKGTVAQKLVSKQMARYAAEYGAKFIISAGDNIYDAGVNGLNDPLFKTRFEEVYTQPSLQVPWYMALGDHDHRGDVQAQVDYSKKSKKWHMDSPYFVREISLGGNNVLQMIFTDSVGLEGAVAEDKQGDRRFAKDYNATFAGYTAGMKQLSWLTNVLRDSHPTWRIVIGHRPILSCALRPRYPAESRFVEMIKPLLEKYKVDVYLNGHDHVGQHLEENGIVYIGNGVGGYGTHASRPIPQTRWVNGEYSGFMLHKVTPINMEFTFVDYNGTILHKVNLYKDVLQKPKKDNFHVSL